MQSSFHIIIILAVNHNTRVQPVLAQRLGVRQLDSSLRLSAMLRSVTQSTQGQLELSTCLDHRLLLQATSMSLSSYAPGARRPACPSPSLALLQLRLPRAVAPLRAMRRSSGSVALRCACPCQLPSSARSRASWARAACLGGCVRCNKQHQGGVLGSPKARAQGYHEGRDIGGAGSQVSFWIWPALLLVAARRRVLCCDSL